MQVVSDGVDLPDPVARVSEPHWLFAETLNLKTLTVLVIYRSPWLKETDPMYEPVADLLGRCPRVEFVHRDQIVDPKMMFGRAEWVVYFLHQSPVEVPIEDPKALKAIEIVRSFSGKPVHPIITAKEIFHRLELTLDEAM